MNIFYPIFDTLTPFFSKANRVIVIHKIGISLCFIFFRFLWNFQISKKEFRHSKGRGSAENFCGRRKKSIDNILWYFDFNGQKFKQIYFFKNWFLEKSLNFLLSAFHDDSKTCFLNHRKRIESQGNLTNSVYQSGVYPSKPRKGKLPFFYEAAFSYTFTNSIFIFHRLSIPLVPNDCWS